MERFEEIQVERLNIVGPDGTPRFVFANEARLPQPIIDGKEVGDRQGIHGPCIIIYNELGDECGGFSFHAAQRDGNVEARSMLLFDQFRNNEVFGIVYDESRGKQSYAIVGNEPSRIPITEILEREEQLSKIEDENARAQAKEELYTEVQQSERLFVGRTREGAAVVSLSDEEGRPRLRMIVDSDGDPRIEFLDPEGQATHRFPPLAPDDQ